MRCVWGAGGGRACNAATIPPANGLAGSALNNCSSALSIAAALSAVAPPSAQRSASPNAHMTLNLSRGSLATLAASSVVIRRCTSA
ncbi:hypothetical protein D3C83_37730 [compost metagenome]